MPKSKTYQRVGLLLAALLAGVACAVFSLPKSKTYQRVGLLLAALLAGVACAVFSPPAATPTVTVPTPRPAATPTVTMPTTRPADFAVRYDWAEGSLPPPYHYEYTIDIAADGAVTLTYVPDYPGDEVPVWTETLTLEAAALDGLYADLAGQGLFTTDWRGEDDTPVGGSSERLTATANGVTIEVPAYPVPEQRAAQAALAEIVRAVIPAATWDSLAAQREEYIAEHSE
jgi:hypothetical protein